MESKYLALATDFDGTIAAKGLVSKETLQALERAAQAGYKLILVTGRHLDDLLAIFPELLRFDVAVVENGALVYWPIDQREQIIGDPPPAHFIRELAQRGVKPLSGGKVIVETRVPNETIVLQVIRDLNLELQVIFNKGAVMILPSGVNKAIGLMAALEGLKLSPKQVVGFGDAENDHAFLEVCGYSVAVANALPTIQHRAHHVTTASFGAGVEEFINRLLQGDVPPGAAA